MQRDKQAVATLGDLIAAVTDEVSPLTNNPTKTNVLVSYILNDLFVTKRVRFRQGRMANRGSVDEAMQVYVALQPLVALIAGILILIIPRLLNYIVAVYIDRYRAIEFSEGVMRPEPCVKLSEFCSQEERRTL